MPTWCAPCWHDVRILRKRIVTNLHTMVVMKGIPQRSRVHTEIPVGAIVNPAGVAASTAQQPCTFYMADYGKQVASRGGLDRKMHATQPLYDVRTLSSATH